MKYNHSALKHLYFIDFSKYFTEKYGMNYAFVLEDKDSFQFSLKICANIPEHFDRKIR
jgi:hypothetical protein